MDLLRIKILSFILYGKQQNMKARHSLRAPSK